MMKVSRREVTTFILGGLAALIGIPIQSEKSRVPETCESVDEPKKVVVSADGISQSWEFFPYDWCDYDHGSSVRGSFPSSNKTNL